MQAILQRFAATGAETAISITRAVTHHRLGLRLAFDSGVLDVALMSEAVRLSLDAEPVLGCAFRTDERHAYWERLSDLDERSAFSWREYADVDTAMIDFQVGEIPDEGPQVAVALFMGPDRDELGVKVSHVVADGQAAKQYTYLLADIYSRLAVDASYAPQPNLVTRPTGRQVWGHLSSEQRRNARQAKSWAKPVWKVPGKGSSGGGLTYRTALVEPRRFRELRAFAGSHDATINDLMLTAVFRACAARFDPPTGVPLSLMCTADLRRFLPDRESLPISNVSISGSLDIERVEGESFDQTLVRVRQRMAVWSKQCYGAAPFMNAERLAGFGYRPTQKLLGLTFRLAGGSGKTYPWFTNIGVLDESRLAFGEHYPIAGQAYGPSAKGPAIVPVISTYRDALSICMGFCRDDMNEAVIDDVLSLTIAELDNAGGVSDKRIEQNAGR